MGFLKNLRDFYELIVKGDKPLWLLEFGGGPSLYALISAAKHVDKIVFAEYAENNRREVEMWVEGKTGSKLESSSPHSFMFSFSLPRNVILILTSLLIEFRSNLVCRLRLKITFYILHCEVERSMTQTNQQKKKNNY